MQFDSDEKVMAESLSLTQAYKSMYELLDEYYRLTGSDDIGALLGGLSLLPDGTTADPAAAQDWLNAVKRVLIAEKNGDFTTANLKFVKE